MQLQAVILALPLYASAQGDYFFTPLPGPTPAPLYKPYVPSMYAKPLTISTAQPLAISTAQPLALSPLAISTAQPLSVSTAQPLAISVDQPLAISTAQPLAVSPSQFYAHPLLISNSQPLAVSPPAVSTAPLLPVYGPSIPLAPVASVAPLPPITTSVPLAGFPVYGPLVTQVTTQVPVTVVTVPPPPLVDCLTQNKLDLIKCYGIKSGCFVTQCGLDGSYLPKQCSVFPCAPPDIGKPCPQCWCVDVWGTEIPGSRANATEAFSCTIPIPTRIRVPVRHRDRGNNLLLCLVRPSLCFGGGGGGGGLPP